MSGARGKTDAADAAAICEAVQRPSMRLVPIKSEQQQSQLMVHRARQGYVQARTACINRIRGFLAEFGHVLPLKADTVHRQAAGLLAAAAAVVAMLGNGHEFKCGRQFAGWLGLARARAVRMHRVPQAGPWGLPLGLRFREG